LLQAALYLRESHDNYRRQYGEKLEYYVDRQANRPDADFETGFSKHWLEGWHDLIRNVDHAGKAAIEGADQVRAASVTIFDPMDDQDPNSPYSVEWWDNTSMEQLDRSRIERWRRTSIIVGVWGPKHPAEEDEAELKKQAECDQLGLPMAKGPLDISDHTPMTSQNDLSTARKKDVGNQAATHVPQTTRAPLQRIEQSLRVEKATSIM
jgi:hypothetical protein